MQRVALFSIALALVAFADVNEEGGKQVQEYAAVIDRIPSWLASVEVTRRDLENWEADHRPLPPSPKPGPWRTTFGKDFGVIPDTGRPFRVLFVSELEVYVTSMSRWYFHAFEAMKKIPGVEAHLWGPGFPGFEDSLTTSENVAKKFGSALYFDFFFNHTFRRNNDRVWKGLGSPVPPVAVWHHECVYNERLPTREISSVMPCSHEADIIFHAYANHMAYFTSQSVGRLLWHEPHAVHLPLHSAASDPNSDRPIDVLLVGRIWSVYPLRQRFQKLFETGKMPGNAVHYQHPGYWFPEGTDPQSPETVEKQSAEYIRNLESAKIIVMCTSKRHYAVRKYAEAAAAGALVIADIPEEREDEFRRWVVEVNLSDSDEVLIETVRWWLDHPKERIERAALGQKIVQGNYTSEHAAAHILDAMHRFQNGQRGMIFRHPFHQVDHFLPKTKACMPRP